MQDLEFRFLTRRMVSNLTGLSPHALRRWEQRRLAGRSGRSPRGRPVTVPRLYSWREVDEIQQAGHLAETGRLSMDEIRRILERSQAAARDRDWVIARPKPKAGLQSRGARSNRLRGASRTPRHRRTR